MTHASAQSHVGTMDILAAAFFVIAGAWLLIALLYSSLVLIFLRLRSRGELGSIYEEDFGRVYLFGSRRYYIPLGCIFRRYIAHLQYDGGYGGGSSGASQRGGSPNASGSPTPSPVVRFMTRDERRTAMDALLVGAVRDVCANKTSKVCCSLDDSKDEKDLEKGKTVDHDDDDDDDDGTMAKSTPPIASSNIKVDGDGDDFDDDNEDINLCSICLGDLSGDGEPVLQSQTCSHHFHTACILDWLQRAANTECPCCRVAMVSEDDVWQQVKSSRKLKRRAYRQRRRKIQQALQRHGLQVELAEDEMNENQEPGLTERSEDDGYDEGNDDNDGVVLVREITSTRPNTEPSSGQGEDNA